MSGIYIHIPFCRSRCIYCGFYSTTAIEMRSKYVDALCKEFQLRRDYLNTPVSTIYFGGGTPSLLLRDDFERIFDALTQYNNVDIDGSEITLECNPDDVTVGFAKMVASLPFNRISMGAQSFSDKLLRFMRRRHCARQISEAVERIRDAGICNISIDLMFGFPGQKVEQWCNDLDEAIKLNVPHVSAYSLMYEEGTPLHSLLMKKKIEETADSVYLAMYNELIDKLKDCGYDHYEISNFAKPGYRSRHNSSYWHSVPYLGVGSAAHSYDVSSRQWNVENLTEYIASIDSGIVPCEREVLTKDMQYDDIITTTLRTSEGINLDNICNAFGEQYLLYLKKESEKHIVNGNLVIENNCLHLTRNGIFMSNQVMADLMHV